MKTSARIAICLGCSLLAHLLVLGVSARQSGGAQGYRVIAVRDALQARLQPAGGRATKPVETPPFVPAPAAATDQVADKPVLVLPDAPRGKMRDGFQLPEPRAFDSPPSLLSALELESAQRPDTAGFVINFRILVSEDGRAQKVEVTSNWLDESLTRDLMRQLEQARYRPAIRDGRPVSAELEGGFALDEEKKGPADAGPGNSLSTQR